MTKKLAPVHPGAVLREDFLVPLGLSAGTLARVVGVPRTRIERLVNEQTALTADTALRLSRAFGTTPAFWMGLQAQYDIERAEDELGGRLKKITPIARDVAA
jgi:antitoxin HigA-1